MSSPEYEYCDWRVQSEGDCEGVTYISFLYTMHIISSFLFLFMSIGILIYNIWWKGQKIWEFSRSDNAFRPRPTEGFVFWCVWYFLSRCVLSIMLITGLNDGKRHYLENFADLPWVFVTGALGFYLVGIIYATPASFSSYYIHNKISIREPDDDNVLEKNNKNNNNNDGYIGRFSSLMGPKQVYLPKPMALNFLLLGMIILPWISNQILASVAGLAYDHGNLILYKKLVSIMYGLWALVAMAIFVLYVFFGKQLLTIISYNIACVNDTVGRTSSRVGVSSESEDNERHLNTLKATYHRMRAIIFLCGSLSPLMGLMMFVLAFFRAQILSNTAASQAFSLFWVHGASIPLGCSLIFILFRNRSATC